MKFLLVLPPIDPSSLCKSYRTYLQIYKSLPLKASSLSDSLYYQVKREAFRYIEEIQKEFT